MTKQVLICVNMPEDLDAFKALSVLIPTMDDDSGSYTVGGVEVDWNLLDPQEAIDIDPRQRQAVADLLMAFDLPAELTAVSRSMLLGAIMNPGGTIQSMGPGNRRAMLEKAKGLIEEMLSEIA